MAAKKAAVRAARKLVWTDRALRDLRAIDAYIAADDPLAAERWISKLLTAAERASRFPQSGHVVREKGRSDLRQILVRTYRIVVTPRRRASSTELEVRHRLRSGGAHDDQEEEAGTAVHDAEVDAVEGA